MPPENKLLLKRTLIVCLALLIGASLALPFTCATTAPDQVLPAPQTIADASVSDCDVSCPLPVRTKVFAQENWQLAVPDINWTQLPFNSSDIKVALMADEPQNLLILFIKNPLDKDVTLADFAIGGIRTFALDDFQIDTVKQLTIHDQKFVLAQVHKASRFIWIWLTVKDNAGYVFTCGGDVDADAGTNQLDTCISIAETIEIK